IPMWRTRFNGGSLQQMVDAVSLYALQDYLQSSDKIAVMHNADDIILGPGDLGFLRRTFDSRLTVYPLGGHCGNLNYKVNTQAMLHFFHHQGTAQGLRSHERIACATEPERFELSPAAVAATTARSVDRR